ncbi:T-cell surface glycoprotein CD3 zeta chain-like [Antennarius striatus]|uniref:T-cell surface glycoprotein CD3 zeta chain-like n=1 Tax=Antennarius striatus TaxID=241820 RepID=UPI0035B054FE
MSRLLLLAALLTPAEAMKLYNPSLCFILDGFLGLYAIIITALFIKEKIFRSRMRAAGEGDFNDRKGQESGDLPLLRRGDPERGRNRRMMDEDQTYKDWTKRPEGEYKELPVKRERQRRNEQVYQGLSSATKATYDSLQMKPLPAR